VVAACGIDVVEADTESGVSLGVGVEFLLYMITFDAFDSEAYF
jgi:hypothetical protein